MLGRTIMAIMAGIILMSLANTTWANEDVAVVQRITQTAWAQMGGEKIALEAGASVKEHYRLHTDASGKLALRFTDGSVLILDSLSSVEVADFVFGGNEEPSFAVNLLNGAMRVVSGAVVEQNPEGFKLTTPLAVAGIRGTTVEAITTTDKDIIRVTEMNPGHSVHVTTVDGRYTEITSSGMQVEIVRGQQGPLTPQPIGGDSGVVGPDDGSGDDNGSAAELPHRDVGEQMNPLMVQQAAPLLDIALPEIVTPSPPPVPPVPPVQRTTYPAFLMGLPVSPGYQVSTILGLSMSRDGGTVVMTTDGGVLGTVGYELWRNDGNHVLLHSVSALPNTGHIVISGDGNFAVRLGHDIFLGSDLPTVYNLNTLQTYTLPHPEGVATEDRLPHAINDNGSIIAGSFTSQLFPGVQGVARWDYDQVSNAYVAVPLTSNGVNPLEGQAWAVSDDGRIIGGYANNMHRAAFWTAAGGGIYTQTLLAGNPGGDVMAITPDGAWLTGSVDNGLTYQAFLASSGDGGAFQFLPIPAGYDTSGALALADDRSVVVGSISDSSGTIPLPSAFFWHEATNTSYDINSHLSSHGVNMGSVHLLGAYAVSADGSIVACVGSDGAGSNLAYLARIDGDFLGITSPSNVYNSLSATAGGASSLITGLPMANLPGTTFSSGNIPAAGAAEGGSTLRVWASGTFMNNSNFSNSDQGAAGGAGATYFMDNGFSIGGGVYYGYRSVYSLWDSKQELENVSFSLQGGYAPEITGIRAFWGTMAQNYDLDTRRNYPNGAQTATSSGGGTGWGFGFIGHLGWVFEAREKLTIQPFVEHTWQWLTTPAYTERGGPFPASYDSHSHIQNITRIGADIQWDVRPDLNLQFWLAFNHRYESQGPASSGEILGWQTFYFNGNELKRNWGDTGVGLRWRFMDNTCLGFRLGFGIDNRNSGLPDVMSSLSLSVDI